MRDSRTPTGRPTIGVLALVVVLFLFAGAIYAATGGRYLNGIEVVVFTIPFAIYAARSFGYLAPKTVEVPTEVSDNRNIEISDIGISFDSSTSRQTKAWDEFKSYLETKKLILLYQKDKFVRIIPKRVVLPDQLSGIREILNAKLPLSRGSSKSKLMF